MDQIKAVCAVFIDFREAFELTQYIPYKFTRQSASPWNRGKPVEMAYRLPFY